MAYTSKRFQRVVRIKFFSSWLRETTSFRGGSWARRGWEIHMWLWYFTENDTCTKCSGSPEVSWYEIMHAWTYCSSVQYINFINIFINSDLSSSLKRFFFSPLHFNSLHCYVVNIGRAKAIKGKSTYFKALQWQRKKINTIYSKTQ